MKKLFFFRFSSSNGNNNAVPSPPVDQQVYWGNGDKADCIGKTRKQISDVPGFSNDSRLRRSLSSSSAAFLVDGLGKQNFSCSNDQNRSPDIARRRAKRRDTATIGFERPCSSGSSRMHHDSFGSSSSCSSHVSSKVIDRYIDGEQLQESSKLRNGSKRHDLVNGGRRLAPPRVRYTAPSSPTDCVKEKNKSHTCLHFSSRDWVENGFGHESPRMVAKNVIEKLSQTRVVPRSSSKEFDRHVPITTENVIGCHGDFSGLEDFGGSSDGSNTPETEEDTDEELQRRSKEADERVLLLSESLEQESFLRDSGFDVSSLVQSVRRLTEEKIKLALEVSDLLQSRIAERGTAREELRMAKAEFESQIKKLEKEKHEMQLGLEKEFDRRSSDWSNKLEKYRLEEQRLREQVRELAEQNVSLQREVSSFNDKETENRSIMTYSAEQLNELTRRVEKSNDENRDLRKNLSQSQEKYRAAIEDVACVRRNLEAKEKECKELQKSVTRLLRTCNEQEKTIEGLREGYGWEIETKQSMEKNEKQVKKLQMEQMRLTGVELALRREVKSCKLETYSLRHENIDLLNRLKGNRKEITSLNTFKLDNEMRDRVWCLQNQGLSMLNESTDLCSKLIEFINGRTSQLQETQQGLDFQFIVESDMKLEGFKHGVERLTRSLQTISTLLQEKSSSVASNSHSAAMDSDVTMKLSNQASEDIIRTELKAETLLTSLLREKLYSKELEIEQLQAEIAAAVRGNDILRCEVQNAMDNISCLTHRLKDLELQIPKKDEKISRLQGDLQESMKELTILKGILPKVSQERDLMWEEVKQYSEKNMLLNSEVNALRKKIEGLTEEILLKEGQITILKDTLSSNTFDLLGSPDSMREILLE